MCALLTGSRRVRCLPLAPAHHLVGNIAVAAALPDPCVTAYAAASDGGATPTG